MVDPLSPARRSGPSRAEKKEKKRVIYSERLPLRGSALSRLDCVQLGLGGRSPGVPPAPPEPQCSSHDRTVPGTIPRTFIDRDPFTCNRADGASSRTVLPVLAGRPEKHAAEFLTWAAFQLGHDLVGAARFLAVALGSGACKAAQPRLGG